MIILGINAYHGDAAAAIIRDGVLVAAAEEERFNRVKHCAGFPAQAVRYCLHAAGVGIEEVDHIGISRDPSAHLHKKVLFAASRAAKQLKGNQSQAGGRQQKEAIPALADATAGRMPALPAGGSLTVAEGLEGSGAADSNGRRSGMFAQIRDRLSNAAR